MEKLRNLLFYGGAMPDVYRNCRDEIRKENLEKLFFFLSVDVPLGSSLYSVEVLCF